MKRLMLVLTSGVLMMALASTSSAQDMKQDMKKEMKDKMEMKKEGKGMASFSCAPTCGFKVQSPDDAEVKEMARMHAKKHHGKDLSDEEMKKMMKRSDDTMKGDGKKMEDEK